MMNQYWRFANNISNGFYSHINEIDLTNGPGYPLIILPFIILKSPIAIAKYLNVFLMFLAVLFFYKTLLLYTSTKKSILFAYFLGLYIPMFKYITRLETEMLTFFLVSAFVYYFSAVFVSRSLKFSNFFIAAFLLCFLAMTKVFFGYVFPFSILTSLLLYIVTREKIYRRAMSIYLLALIFCLPYLYYTFTLTGKVFYWSTNGGDILYSSVSPYPNEYGDYIIGPDIYDTTTAISKNHFAFVDSLRYLSQYERDQAFRKKAVQIIKAHPAKYIFNWLNNMGRMIFNYPYSHTLQKPGTFFYIIPNSFLFVFAIILLPIYFLRIKQIPTEINLLLLFGATYFWGASLVDAEARHFAIIVPILLLGIAYIFSNILKVDIVKK